LGVDESEHRDSRCGDGSVGGVEIATGVGRM